MIEGCTANNEELLHGKLLTMKLRKPEPATECNSFYHLLFISTESYQYLLLLIVIFNRLLYIWPAARKIK